MSMSNIGTFMDKIDKGVMFISDDKKILSLNDTAKEIIGAVNNHPYAHEGGIVQDGDIVLIADTCLGMDDDLAVSDLKRIGIDDPDLREGDILLAAGIYDGGRGRRGAGGASRAATANGAGGTNRAAAANTTGGTNRATAADSAQSAEYKFFREKRVDDGVTLCTEKNGHRIEIKVTFGSDEVNIDTNEARITVDGVTYSFMFTLTIGHMVIIDGVSGALKFYQSNGYTLRRESIGEILRGRRFLPKSSGRDEYEITGKSFSEISVVDELERQLDSVIQDNEKIIKNKAFDINFRPVVCTIFASRETADGRQQKGVWLVFEGLSTLRNMLISRESVLHDIEKMKLQSAMENVDEKKIESIKYLGSGAKYREIMFMASRAADSKANVLITGESGTGKSLLAREIHDLQREDTPYVEVNCGAIAPSLFESELFGYVKGAFTGASSEGRKGFFEQADGGTIFLDEIGELPLEMQVKLLYVIQNKTIYRVGSTKAIPVDVRIIAATNADLNELVEQKKFRKDLFYRLKIFLIDVSPLRERKEELPMLTDVFLEKFCRKYGMEKKSLSQEAWEKIRLYDWPGNVRELENVLERAVILCKSPKIYQEHINIENKEFYNADLKTLLQRDEEKHIRKALAEAEGDKEKAIERLGLSRSVFYRKLKQYGI